MAAPELVRPRLPSRFEQPLDSAPARMPQLGLEQVEEHADLPSPRDTPLRPARFGLVMRPPQTVEVAAPEAMARPQTAASRRADVGEPTLPSRLSSNSQSEPYQTAPSLPAARLVPDDQTDASEYVSAQAPRGRDDRSTAGADRSVAASHADAPGAAVPPPASRLPLISARPTQETDTSPLPTPASPPPGSARRVAVEPLVQRAMQGTPAGPANPHSPAPVMPAPQLPPSQTAQPASRPAPAIHVTIGRVEVRAHFASPPAPSAPPPRPTSVLSLDDYLKQRDGGGI